MARVLYEHVTKRFGDVVAVNDLTLEIEDKEFLVLVGPSGCGKSTVIRLLAGLETLTEGNIYIGDRLVNEVPARDRDIAMVFQSYALYPHMSVFDNMAFGLRMHGTPRRTSTGACTRRRRPSDIEELLKRKPAQLSGGQRQRVALGRAIVREPQVFLFDEPLSNLDAKLRVQTRTELSKLHQRLRTTFIYVTHDQVEAMTMATRIAVIKDGMLQQVGTPEDLYFRPGQRLRGRFHRQPGDELLPGDASRAGGEMVLDAGALQIELPADSARRLAATPAGRSSSGFARKTSTTADFLPANVGGPVRARVDVTEMMGNEKFLHLLVDDRDVLARVDPRTRARAGRDIDLVFDVDHMHAFDAQSQLAIGTTGD